jgi:hypothetical protein
MTMSETSQLLEYTRGPRPERVDRDKGVIFGVKLLGGEGNKDYPRSTREKARGLLEGLKVFVDHPEPGKAAQARSVRERMGFVRDVRDKDDGSYGDWHFPPKHPLAEAVFWEAENNPTGLGFSINGDGRCKRLPNGRLLCEEIVSLASVDLVDNPATTRGLFEGQEPALTATVAELIEQLKATRPGAARALSEMAEAGLVGGAARMQVAPGQPGASEQDDHGSVFVQGIMQAIAACLKDDKLSWDEKEAAVAQYMKTAKKHVGKAEGNMADDKKTTEQKQTPAPAPEVTALQEQLDREKLKVRSLTLLLESGLTMNPVLAKALQGCQTEDEVKALLEECKKLRIAIGANPPRSAERGAGGSTGTTPITEGKAPTEAKAFAAFVKG